VLGSLLDGELCSVGGFDPALRMIQHCLHLPQAFLRLGDPLAARVIGRKLLRVDPWIKGTPTVELDELGTLGARKSLQSTRRLRADWTGPTYGCRPLLPRCPPPQPRTKA
jgi:hypothetical protein